MADCLFCTLIANAKPGFLIHEDADVVAFRDLHPQAPTHVLVVPRTHFADLTQMEAKTEVIAKMYAAALAIAKKEKIDDGFRTVINTKEKGGQSVFHVHMHLLGGRRLGPGLAGG
jgi:histidine triad (HIT) family protein